MKAKEKALEDMQLKLAFQQGQLKGMGAPPECSGVQETVKCD